MISGFVTMVTTHLPDVPDRPFKYRLCFSPADLPRFLFGRSVAFPKKLPRADFGVTTPSNAVSDPERRPVHIDIYGCGSEMGTQNETLVNGTKD